MSKKIVVTTSNNSEYEKFLNEMKMKSYEIYLRRINKNQSGDELSDWLKAEAEVKSKYKI